MLVRSNIHSPLIEFAPSSSQRLLIVSLCTRNGLRPLSDFVKKRFKRPTKAKIITDVSISILLNLSEIFKPRCNLDVQFSELYS